MGDVMARTTEVLDAYARELDRDPLLTNAEAARDFAARRQAFSADAERGGQPAAYKTDHARPSRRALRVARTLSA